MISPRKTAGIFSRLALGLVTALISGYAGAASDAVTADPPRDAGHPTRNEAVWVPSHGVMMNGVMLAAAGTEAHPTALLIHGLPGNEQNLDLAQALRSGGYNVLTFHFRGSWGSPGRFTQAGGVEDGEAALEFLKEPASVAAFHIDLRRLLVIGHSYGGFVAARVATAHPDLAALVLLAPWDPSEDIAGFRVPDPDLPRVAHKAFDDVEGRLGGVRDVDLARELVAPGYDWQLASHAAALQKMPILMVIATDDSKDDQGGNLQAALKTVASKLTTLTMTTDHPFSDHRIALEKAVTRWLNDRLGGRPP